MLPATSTRPRAVDDHVLRPVQYKTNMTPEHEANWRKNKTEQSEIIANKKRLHDNELCLAQQVVVYAWISDDSHPIQHRDQGIKTWPTYSLAQSPLLLAKLGITEITGTQIDIYSFKTAGWECEYVDRVYKVFSEERLLIRCRGVTRCIRLQELIDDITCIHPSTPMRRGVKRRRSISLDSDDDLEVAPDRSRHRSESTKSSTPCPRVASHSPSPFVLSPPSLSSLPLPIPSLFSTAVAPATASTVVQDDDTLWAAGYVRTPTSRRWPDGMYARDMAKGFKLMHDAPGEKQAQRFAVVFPGQKFVKATFFRHRAVWKDSRVAEREAAASLPRTEDGLWSLWHASASGNRIPRKGNWHIVSHH